MSLGKAALRRTLGPDGGVPPLSARCEIRGTPLGLRGGSERPLCLTVEMLWASHEETYERVQFAAWCLVGTR